MRERSLYIMYCYHENYISYWWEAWYIMENNICNVSRCDRLTLLPLQKCTAPSMYCSERCCFNRYRANGYHARKLAAQLYCCYTMARESQILIWWIQSVQASEASAWVPVNHLFRCSFKYAFKLAAQTTVLAQ